MRRRPAARPATDSTWARAVAMRSRIASAWASSTRPASVSRMPRAVRSSSCAPASRSSAATWRETAGCVKLSASAAADSEPRRTTSRKTCRRAASSRTGGEAMPEVYGFQKERSFAVMAAEAPPSGHVPVAPPHRHRPRTRADRSARTGAAPADPPRAGSHCRGPAPVLRRAKGPGDAARPLLRGGVRVAGGERRAGAAWVERRGGCGAGGSAAAADVLAAAGDLVLAVGLDRVDAGAAGDRVFAAVARGDGVVARAAGDRVVPGAAGERVVAGVALDVVVAALAALDVVARAAVQVVGARAAVEVVVAALAAHVVVAGVAAQVVVLLGALVVALLGGVVAGGRRRDGRAGRGGRGLVARLGGLGGVAALLALAIAAAVVADRRPGGGRRRGGRAGSGRGRAATTVVIGLDGDGADAERQQRAQAREKHALHVCLFLFLRVCRSGEAGAPGVRHGVAARIRLRRPGSGPGGRIDERPSSRGDRPERRRATVAGGPGQESRATSPSSARAITRRWISLVPS